MHLTCILAPSMALIDEITLQVAAGKGGDGVVRWRSEKYKPKAGPGGGNGGRGGNVYMRAVSDLGVLDKYRYEKKWKAQDGIPGMNLGKHGAKGEDLVLVVPIGSRVLNRTTKVEYIFEEVNQTEMILEGGYGGFGNEHFKSSTNQTPYEFTYGQDGEKAELFIELELIAQIGLVGLPSAGKSSLLNALTNAQSKVGAYHFTTLEPHLGTLKDGTIIADIPGIIEGAHTGKGLGIKFLKHIRRTKVLAHLVDCTHEDPITAYKQIRTELEAYGKGIAEKQEVIVLSKIDEQEESQWRETKELLEHETGKKVIPISVLDDQTLEGFEKEILKVLHS